jgi:hypothetical protein
MASYSMLSVSLTEIPLKHLPNVVDNSSRSITAISRTPRLAGRSIAARVQARRLF